MTDFPQILRRLLVLPAFAGSLIAPMVIAAQARNPDVLMNLPYALAAATATGNAKSLDADKARQDLINKGNRKPTF
jgi:hypothetical protein